MPRTLGAELTAALDSGSFQPYFLLTVREVGGDIIETAQPVYFKLAGINLSLKWARLSESIYEGYTYPHELEFMVTRGVTIAGVNYTIDSSYYYGVSQGWNGIYQTVEACMLPAQRYTAAADVTYKQAIDAICTAHGKTAVYETVGAAWQSYQFLGDGKTITLNRSSDILNWLKQKYIIYACDNGSDEILFKAIGTDAIPVAVDHDMRIGLFKNLSAITGNRRFLYRDEGATIHYDGNAADPLWNLGYLESTASPPGENFSQSFIVDPIAPHLKYLTFDRFRFTMENYPNTVQVSIGAILEVVEEYDNKLKELGWRILLQSFDWAKGTEGGSLPGTIEAAAPYTPLNTSNFDGLLNTNDNNVQAAFETMDDHDHGITFPLPGNASQYLGGDGQWHELPSVVNLFLSATNSAISGYESLTPTRPTGAETNASASITAADQVLEEFALAAGSMDLITAQTMHVHIHMAKTAGTKGATCYTKLFHRTSGGTETEIGVSEVSGPLTGSQAEYNHSISVTDDIEFAATDLLILKILCSPTGAGTDPTVATYFEGTTDARIEVGTHLLTGGVSFNDAEGDPAAVAATAADGTSTYAARRDHAHAGYWILIEDINLTGGAQASFDFQNIPNTYKHLKIELSGRSTRAAAISDSIRIKFNNDAGNNYLGLLQWATGNTEQATAGAPPFFAVLPAANSPANYFSNSEITVFDYLNPNTNHHCQGRGGDIETNSAGNLYIYDAVVEWLSTSAISRITIYPNTGPNFAQYSRATLFGIK